MTSERPTQGPTVVSVVMPCFNAERTIAASIESALAQGGEDIAIDLVAVDDGSTDGSLALLRSLEPAIRVLTGPNRGASAARNRAIEAARGDWFVFLDSDDWIEPGALVRRLQVARSEAADVVICDWIDVNDDGSGHLTEQRRRSIDWPALQADAEVAIASHVWVTTAAILFSRRIVERIGGFRPDLPIIQDARYMFDAAFQGARFAYLPEVGARYRILVDGLSRGNPTPFARDLLRNSLQIAELWRSRGPLSEAQAATVAGMLNGAARSLFKVAHPDYLTAVEAQRRLGEPTPLHSRIAPMLVNLVGLKSATGLLRLIDR